ncbi:MAG: T9SS type A sorting domain-containing protein [Bacteroidetes bacterium]|nr:T9SS type A sorting domain-containing protein [Bacteroidota bacterium]
MKLKMFLPLIFLCGFNISHAQVKILFDATKAQTAGNADWVIDADLHNMNWSPNACVNCGAGATNSNAQRFPTAAQSGINASTPESYWTGALSSWGIDCAKKGYIVETLPYNGAITYGMSSNLQDLSNYKVFIIDEPNILFTTSEKNAIMNFVKNGGGLFMISDHDVSDRNGDGADSPTIWNNLMTTNTVQANGFGLSFDLQNFSQTSSNVIAAANDSIIHGPMGNVTQVKWSNGTSMTLNTAQNASVKGVVFKTGASAGTNSVLCAYGRFYNGKFAAIGDSSPTDDGTGDPNDVLYDGYITDAAGNHQRLLMNITIWLAETGNMASGIGANEVQAIKYGVYPNPAGDVLSINAGANAGIVGIINLTGQEVATVDNDSSADISALLPGIYFAKIATSEKVLYIKFVKN